MTGRPNLAEALVLDYLNTKDNPILDLELDAPALMAAGAAIGLDSFSLRGAVDRLKAKGHLHLLQRGRYLARERASASPRLWSLEPVAEAVLRRLRIDYYVSWHAALWHYNLIDQQSRTVSVAVRQRKRPVQIGSQRVRFVLVSERKFFGHQLVEDLEWPVRMATISRAIIDAFDRPDLIGPPPVIVEALRRAAFDEDLSSQQLVADAARLNSPTLNRRLGFFMDLLGIGGTDELALRVGRGYAEPLFPGREPAVKLEVDPRWRVYRDPAIIGTALELK